MSKENVEVVRDHIEAFTHDAPRALSFLDPFVVADMSGVGTYLGTRPAYGQEAVEREATRYAGAFEDYACEARPEPPLGGLRRLTWNQPSSFREPTTDYVWQTIPVNA